MRRLILLAFGLSLSFFVAAQARTGNSIIGTVVDSVTKIPLEYSTVTLFVKGNKTPFTGTTTDNTGAFKLPDVPPGTYTLVIENIGYKTHIKNELVLNRKDAIIDLKHFFLVPRSKELETVTVTSKAKLVENKIDKMVFNAEKDISSQGGVAIDVLKKVPQVSVDADGNVQLSGSGGIRFLINGKPSSAFGSNITDVLQSIPASQIKSIEVITSPGAKYDAQGLSGIINIILKQNNSKGYNGNIAVTAGTRNENASVNFNVRNNNFGVNAFFSGNKRLRSAVTTDNTRVTAENDSTGVLNQTSNSHFYRQGYQSGIGFDWTYKKHNNFSGNMAYNYFGFKGDGSTNQSLQPDKGGTVPDILSLINSGNQYRYHSADAFLNYKRTFAKEDQELEISASTENGSDRGNSYSAQYRMPQDSLNYGTKSYNPAKTTETILSIDYAQPLPRDVKLGFGGKTTFYTINSRADVNSYRPATDTYLPDDFLSSNLHYRQKVYAAYAEMSFAVPEFFNAKIGGRYERTEINAYYSNAGQVTIPGYNTFVPSLFLSRNISENQTIKLSYSKRINRPDYEDLNPFVNTTDPKNLSTGNPYLKPEIGHRFELGYSAELGKTGSLTVNLFHRINEHDIQPYIVYYAAYKVGDSLYTNTSVNTSQNIGRENNTGLNLFADLHITAKLNIRSNAFVFYRHTVNAIDKGYDTNSFNYRFNLNTTYQFTNSLVAEFFGNFNSARHEAQGRYPSFTSYTIAMRKQFWKKKGSIALTATNPFSENLTQKTILTGTNFTVYGTRNIPFRSIGLNFTWKFGKLEFKKEKQEVDTNLNAPMQ